ncbi:MAG: DinB family protein [Acidobacteriaceae bacterium]
MLNNEILSLTVLNSWKLIISRFDKILGDLTDEQLHQPVALGKNRVFYLLGHLTATHDRMFPLLGLGDRLHPELDDTYITNPDKLLEDPLSATELRRAWAEVNGKLTTAFERFTLEDWLQKPRQFPMGILSKTPRATGLQSWSAAPTTRRITLVRQSLQNNW